MQGDATERMHDAVRSLEAVVRRLKSERARERAAWRHTDLFAALAEEARDERVRP